MIKHSKQTRLVLYFSQIQKAGHVPNHILGSEETITTKLHTCKKHLLSVKLNQAF